MAPSLRSLPSVDRVLADGRLGGVPHALAVESVRVVLDRAREDVCSCRDPGDLVEATLAGLETASRPSLRRGAYAPPASLPPKILRAPPPPAALPSPLVGGGGRPHTPRH